MISDTTRLLSDYQNDSLDQACFQALKYQIRLHLYENMRVIVFRNIKICPSTSSRAAVRGVDEAP